MFRSEEMRKECCLDRMRLCSSLTVLFLVMRSVGCAEVVDPPRDVTVKIGDTARLICGVDGNVSSDPFKWVEFQTDRTGNTIYKNPNIGSGVLTEGNDTKYSIEGTYDLRIHNTQFEDAGEYACSVFSQSSPLKAKLVVLGIPRLSFGKSPLIEGEQTAVKCSVDYAAPSSSNPGQIPSLQIMMGNKLLYRNVQHSRENGESYVSLSQMINITWQATHSGQMLNCSVLSDDPQYSYSSGAEINILYPVRNVRVSPVDSRYAVGDVVRCEANGNPPPSYVWQDTSGKKDHISGPSFNIDQDMIGSDNRWKCVATNTINKQDVSEEITINFDVVSRPIMTGAPGYKSAAMRKSTNTVLVIKLLLEIALALLINS